MLLEDLRRDYEILKGKSSVALVVRHAEKTGSQATNPIVHSPISEKGKEDSRRFGRKISALFPRIVMIKSSPIARCLSTADRIVAGTDQVINILPSNRLGDPGAFVTDDKIGWEIFQRFDVEEVVRRQLEGERLEGMREVREGAKLLLEEMLEDLKQMNGLVVYVTHDAILCPFVGYLTNTLITPTNWFGFLDGAYLWLEGNGVNLLWGGQVFNVTERVEELIR